MCTIALAWNVFETAPIVVGANREERWERPADGPQHLDTSIDVFAPIDEVAGGTWIGVNEAGVFAAITNRWGGPTGERSRGLLLRDILEKRGAEEADHFLNAELEARTYAGFNLVIATDDAAVVVEWDGDCRRTWLEPGVHVVVNGGLHDTVAKGAVIRTRLLPSTQSSVDTYTDRLPSVLTDHEIRACVHEPTRGTRSSSLIVIGADGRTEWRFADGPPCETPYRPVLEGEL